MGPQKPQMGPQKPQIGPDLLIYKPQQAWI